MTKVFRAFMDWVLDWIGRLPSTNARVAVSLALYVATGVKVIWIWEPPPWEWLLFLGATMGLDVAQFATKRVTDRSPTPFNGERPPAAEG